MRLTNEMELTRSPTSVNEPTPLATACQRSMRHLNNKKFSVAVWLFLQLTLQKLFHRRGPSSSQNVQACVSSRDPPTFVDGISSVPSQSMGCFLKRQCVWALRLGMVSVVVLCLVVVRVGVVAVLLPLLNRLAGVHRRCSRCAR